jgi:DNA repair protein RadC
MSISISIRDLPREQRPREKLAARGAEALSDAELLAVLLGSGHSGRNAVELGTSLLADAGGLKSLLDLPRHRMRVGRVSWCRIRAGIELGRRYADAQLRTGARLSDPSVTAQYLKTRLGGYAYEVFACLFLDNRHRVISFQELFRGSIDGAHVHPREVVRSCLLHNAAAVILAHNHPSGITEPSAADRAITLRLREALGLIDVRVLDHFIVGDGVPVSLARRGWL